MRLLDIVIEAEKWGGAGTELRFCPKVYVMTPRTGDGDDDDDDDDDGDGPVLERGGLVVKGPWATSWEAADAWARGWMSCHRGRTP